MPSRAGCPRPQEPSLGTPLSAPMRRSSEPIIVIRSVNSAVEVNGMRESRGILTARGGATSHAAVVARGMGRACVVGCSALSVDYELQLLTVREHGESVIVRAGDLITIDG